MIVGVGTDIELVNRFRIMKDSILNRVIRRILTEKEISYCFQKKDPFPCITGRYCGKEAFLKALNLKNFSMFKWKEMEIMGSPPKFYTYGEVKKFIEKRKIEKIWLSISHTDEYAIAIVILEK